MLLKNREFWLIVLTSIFGCLFVIFFLKWMLYSCPEPTTVEIKEKYVQEIKEISEADNKHDIDSLLLKHFGFKSE